MRYGSVCAGIEAITMGWHGLGYTPAFFSEIDAAPRAVLSHHYPDVPLHGDFTTIQGDEYGPIDLLVGGTPCQSFSVAGLRGGLGDDRGNLALEFLRLADRTRARWLVWENVPGVLSSNGGRDFGSILGGMVELGYGLAYRVLDAQHFGVPQRRRRVFVVGHLGDWRRAAAVLFERHSLQGHSAPRREKGQDVAGVLTSRASGGGGGHGAGTDEAAAGYLQAVAYGGNNTAGAIDIATAINAHGGPCGRMDFESETFIAHSLRGEGFDASEDGAGRGTPLVPVTAYQTSGNCGAWETGQVTGALDTNTDPNSHYAAMGTKWNGNAAATNGSLFARQASAVRRLTPRECERLQGFPDDFTLVPYRGKLMADGPRYKMLGNSMAVPVVRWIGERIQAVEALQLQAEAA